MEKGQWLLEVTTALFMSKMRLVLFCRNLGDNAIRSIQADAFARMKNLKQL